MNLYLMNKSTLWGDGVVFLKQDTVFFRIVAVSAQRIIIVRAAKGDDGYKSFSRVSLLGR